MYASDFRSCLVADEFKDELYPKVRCAAGTKRTRPAACARLNVHEPPVALAVGVFAGTVRSVPSGANHCEGQRDEPPQLASAQHDSGALTPRRTSIMLRSWPSHQWNPGDSPDSGDARSAEFRPAVDLGTMAIVETQLDRAVADRCNLLDHDPRFTDKRRFTAPCPRAAAYGRPYANSTGPVWRCVTHVRRRRHCRPAAPSAYAAPYALFVLRSNPCCVTPCDGATPTDRYLCSP